MYVCMRLEICCRCWRIFTFNSKAVWCLLLLQVKRNAFGGNMHVFLLVFTRPHTCKFTHTCIFVHTCKNQCLWLLEFIYIPTNAYIYTGTQTHTHINILALSCVCGISTFVLFYSVTFLICILIFCLPFGGFVFCYAHVINIAAYFLAL